MLLHIHPDNPNARHIKTIVDCLLSGGIIIYPTDTIYGLGCDIFKPKAIERIARIKQIDPAKAQLSFVCSDLSNLSKYCKTTDTPLYRILKTDKYVSSRIGTTNEKRLNERRIHRTSYSYRC